MAMMMGETNILEVVRETDFSYILTDGEIEVFLHKKQATVPLNPGEKIEVFLYFDNQKRITATMTIPNISTTNPVFCDVIDINKHLGVFLDVGLIKDLLLSRDDLPYKKSQWPKVGDRLFVKMRASKHQLTAKIISRYEYRKYLNPNTELIEGEHYNAYTLYFVDDGTIFTTEEGHIIFVYYKHIRKELRLGEKVNIKITNAKANHEYNGTMIEQKELMMSQDAETIKAYLEAHDGMMTITDKSSSEDIFTAFKMSKNAFKRAIGSLYKEKIIVLHSEHIELKRD